MKNTSIPTKNILSFQIDPELFEPATEEQKRQQEIDKPGMSFFRDALRRLWRNKLAMVCFFTIVFISLIAFIVPAIYPYTYTKQDVSAQYMEPFEYSAKELARIEREGERLDALVDHLKAQAK